MPWSKNDYPVSFKNLNEDVRDKAIEIANALLKDGYEESRAIPIALSKAKQYVHGDSDRPEYEVVSDGDVWKLKKVDGERAIMSEDTKSDLLDKAKSYVNEHDGILNIYKEDGSFEDQFYE
jgi:uncharacterized protein YdaT